MITKPEPEDNRSTRETLFRSLFTKAYRYEILAYYGSIWSVLESLYKLDEKQGLYLTLGRMVLTFTID